MKTVMSVLSLALNLLAISIATVVGFVLGGLWGGLFASVLFLTAEVVAVAAGMYAAGGESRAMIQGPLFGSLYPMGMKFRLRALWLFTLYAVTLPVTVLFDEDE